jgi:hypothetical protein
MQVQQSSISGCAVLEHPRVAPEIERIQTLLAHVDADY